MFYIAIGAWLAGVVVSLINHNRKLPLSIFSIGTLVIIGQFTIGFGHFTIVAIALLAAVIWIANKLDMN